jgi:hypothetical protein
VYVGNDLNSYCFDWTDPFEFSAKMPEELLVKAMQSTRPIFLTDHFMVQISGTTADQVVRDLVTDLHRETDPDETGDVLRWHYLFMDFEKDFPRMLMMRPDLEGDLPIQGS